MRTVTRDPHCEAQQVKAGQNENFCFGGGVKWEQGKKGVCTAGWCWSPVGCGGCGGHSEDLL